MEQVAFPIATALFALSLAGCSGGSGGTSPAPTGVVTSTLTFPLQSAYKSTVAGGWSRTFVVSGDCKGSGSTTLAPASTSATLEGIAGFSASQTITMNLADCSLPSNQSTGTNYYDRNYDFIGYAGTGIYGVAQSPFIIPSSVTVGSAGVIGTITFYADRTKSVQTGRQDQSYAVEPDTANTAIISRIDKLYNDAGTLISSEQTRYRIAATGALALISTDLQYASPSPLHIVLTYN